MVALAFVAGGFAGCTTPRPPPPLSADAAASAFEARSLQDPSLHRYLREQLGAEPAAWDFEALCWVGFYDRPSLAVARAQWAAARAAQRTAVQRPNPSLTLSPGYNFTRDPGLSPWMPSLGLDLPVPTAGKGDRQAAVAQANAEAARLAITSAAWQLRSDLRQALVDAQTAARHATALHTQADAQRSVLVLLQQRFAAGAVSATEVATARIAEIRAVASAADADSQVAISRAKVAAVLGLPAAALATVPLPMPPAPAALSDAELAALRRTAIRSRADVLGALARYDAAAAAVQLEYARRYPDLHLGPSYQWDQGQNKWSLGLTLELPVWNHNEGPIAEAEARCQQAMAEFNAVQAQVIAAVDLATAAWRAARAQQARLHALRSEAEQQARLMQQQAQLGGADQLQVQTARLDVAAAELALVDAESAVAAAAGQLEDALQVPFPRAAAVTATPPQ